MKKILLSLLLAMSIQTVNAESSLVQLSQSNYEQNVVHNSLPVVIDAYTDWCGPCKKITPILEDLNKEMGNKILFTKLNIEKEKDLSNQFNIQSIPTIIFMKDGKEVGRVVGLQTKDQLKAKFKQYFN